jgi:uncharacterized membrane protein YhaH (DUF805 family)
MDFSSAVVRCFANYANFRGRAVRSEFWYFQLFYLLALLFFRFAPKYAVPFVGARSLHVALALVFALLIINLAFVLVCFLPGLAVSVRRLHDIDRSGWWLLLGFVPIVGVIVLIVWHCTRGTDGPNRFGDPDDALPAAGTPAPARTASAPAGARPQPMPPRAMGRRSEFGLRQYQR